MIKIPPKTRLADPGTMSIQASLGASSAEARAFGEIGQALGLAGEKLASITTKIAEAHTSKEISEVELDARSAEAEFYAGIDGRQDPENWLGEFGAVSQGVRERAAGRNISKNGRRILDAKLKAWEIGAGSKLGLQVASTITKQTRDSFFMLDDVYRRNGDTTAREANWDAMEASEVVPESVVTGLRENAKTQRVFDSLMQRAENAPGEVIDEIEYAPLDDQSKRAIKSQVERTQRQQQRQAMDELTYMLAENPKDPITKEQVARWVDSGGISHANGARLLSNVNTPYNKADWQEYVDLKAAIYSVNPGDPQALLELEAKILSSKLTREDKSRKLAALKTTTGNSTSRSIGPLMTTSIAYLKTIAKPEARGKPGAFGLEQMPIQDADGEWAWVNKPGTFRASNLKVAEIADNLEKWLLTDPEGMKANRTTTTAKLHELTLAAGFTGEVFGILDRWNASSIDPSLFPNGKSTPDYIDRLYKSLKQKPSPPRPLEAIDPAQQGLPQR